MKLCCFCKNKTFLFILLFIFPSIMLSFWLFNPFETIPVNYEKISENSSVVIIPEDYFNKPSIRNSISKVFGVPFDLEYYVVYLVDNSYITEENGSKIGNTSWTVKIGDTIINTTSGGISKLKYVKPGQNYDFHLTFNLDIYEGGKIRNAPGKLYTGFDLYAKPNIYDVVVKSILLFFALIGLVQLLYGAYEFISNLVAKNKQV